MPSPSSDSSTQPPGGVLFLWWTYMAAIVTVNSGVVTIATAALELSILLKVLISVTISVPLLWYLRRWTKSLAYQTTYRRRIRKSPFITDMRLAGVREPAGPLLKIKDFYIDVELHVKDPSDTEGRQYGRLGELAGKRTRLENLLRRRRKLVFAVSGLAGSGKTTLLRATAYRSANPWNPFSPIPVLVVLGRQVDRIVSDYRPSFAEVALAEPWLDNSGIPAEQLDRWLRKRRCAIMFDGLDEVSEQHRDKVRQWIDEVRENFPDNHVIITSRPQGLDAAKLSGQFHSFEVCPLTREQMQRFIRECITAARRDRDISIKKESPSPRDLMDRLVNQPKLFELARTPLLLHVIVYLYLYDLGLPKGRAKLYEELVKMLIHQRRQGTRTGKAISGLGMEEKLEIMQRLAFHMMCERRPYFNPLPALSDILRDLHPAVDAADLVEDVKDNGLLVSLGHRTHAFAHLSFQEYLAAKHLHATDRIDLLIENIGVDWWRGTTLLWAAEHDPGRVVASCQRRGDGEAWALAIDCAAEAEVRGGLESQVLAQRIDDFLDADHPVDSREHHIVCTERIRRNLQRVQVAKGDLLVCDQPVKIDLYRLFSKEERDKGRISSPHQVAPTDVLLGLWASEVDMFVRWLNKFDHRGFSYRLPGSEELAPSLLRGISDLETHGIWVRSGSRTLASHPRARQNHYGPTPAAVRKRLNADWHLMIDRLGPLGATDSAESGYIAKMVTDALEELEAVIGLAAERARSHRSVVDSVVEEALQSQQRFTNRLLGLMEELEDRRRDGLDLLEVLEVLREAGRVPLPLHHSALEDFHIDEVLRELGDTSRIVVNALAESFEHRLRQYTPRGGESKLLAIAGAMLSAPRIARSDRMLHAAGPAPEYSASAIPEDIGEHDPNRPDDIPEFLRTCESHIASSIEKPTRRFALYRSLAAITVEIDKALQAVLNRKAEPDPEVLASARLALYAAITHLPASGEAAQGNYMLWHCIATLVHLEARSTREVSADEAIILIRDDS